MQLPPHKVLVSKEQIDKRIPELARQITDDVRDKNPLIAVVLKGAFMFAADLIRQFDFPFELDFIATSSYGDSTKSTGIVQLLKDLGEPIKDRTVLLIEDIVDTGLTLHYLYEVLRLREPAQIDIVTFLSKNARRNYQIPVKYIGFEIENRFVVGYGLDYQQNWRGLPYVIAIEE